MREEDAVIISVRIPKKLLEQMDKLIGQGLFQSRSDFLREAIRSYIIRLRETQKISPEIGI
ncbi:MAG: ribbon-helix-helix protein, CopG family [Thermofilum sp.]|jgi:Arc/MetJ-type ribon-helix-helix transcriptional regulator|uniref:ribbon-helix-helix domain-containing protein n=1 Tax=Thermofilum sp. TaxID=1961369 RepID=UPI00258D00B7|nr:ribbon-helix-helix domain-containing protein [Thermofilum sp.]MCI4408088.1 ribbon-helix-helix protein, CopG family [Thermofilum sp.]